MRKNQVAGSLLGWIGARVGVMPHRCHAFSYTSKTSGYFRRGKQRLYEWGKGNQRRRMGVYISYNVEACRFCLFRMNSCWSLHDVIMHSDVNVANVIQHHAHAFAWICMPCRGPKLHTPPYTATSLVFFPRGIACGFLHACIWFAHVFEVSDSTKWARPI
jgi:hypothetical protein